MPKSPVPRWEPSRKPIRNAAEQVLSDLRERILNGQLSAGTKLPTEKELSTAYGVSGNTVREAIRGLATAHLITVRHGSGAYVTAQIDKLMAECLRSIIQVERIRVVDVLATYGAASGVAAELAAANATEEQIAAMQDSLDTIALAKNNAGISAALTRFLDLLADASGNPLLASICRFLSGIQIGLVTELIGDSYAVRKRRATRLVKERQALLDAIKARDTEAARAAAHSYNQRATTVLTAPHGAQSPGAAGLELSQLLTSLLERELR